MSLPPLNRFLITMSILLTPWTVVASKECRQATDTWLNMTSGAIYLNSSNHEPLPVRVRVADDNSELEGGYQWLCREAVANSAILFVLKQPYLGKIHMQNVFTPLDVFFFDKRGHLLKKDHMYPELPGATGKPRYYFPDQPFLYVLEIPTGKVSAKLHGLEQLQLVLHPTQETSTAP